MDEQEKKERSLWNTRETMNALRDMLEKVEEVSFIHHGGLDYFNLEEATMFGSLRILGKKSNYHYFYYDVYPDNMKVRFQVSWPSCLLGKTNDVSLSKMATAMCAVNRRLPNGFFTFNKTDGCLYFLLDNSCADVPVSEAALWYMYDIITEQAFDLGNRLDELAGFEISQEKFLSGLATFPFALIPDMTDLDGHADNVYRTLCDFLGTDPHGIIRSYTMEEATRTAHIRPSETECPVQIDLSVDEEYQMVRLTSTLPVSIPYDRRAAGALAVCCENYSLPAGCFDYDVSAGTVTFRLCESIAEISPHGDLFNYMISRSVHVLDVYYHKFGLLALGHLSPDQI